MNIKALAQRLADADMSQKSAMAIGGAALQQHFSTPEEVEMARKKMEIERVEWKRREIGRTISGLAQNLVQYRLDLGAAEAIELAETLITALYEKNYMD